MTLRQYPDIPDHFRTRHAVRNRDQAAEKKEIPENFLHDSFLFAVYPMEGGALFLTLQVPEQAVVRTPANTLTRVFETIAIHGMKRPEALEPRFVQQSTFWLESFSQLE